MFSYSSFLKEVDALSFEQCREVHDKILPALGRDEELDEIWANFVNYAIDYSQVRAKWYLISQEERQTTDQSRTDKHNRVIVHLKMIATFLDNEGFDRSWFDAIADNRKQIGDFANYISYIYALNGR